MTRREFFAAFVAAILGIGGLKFATKSVSFNDTAVTVTGDGPFPKQYSITFTSDEMESRAEWSQSGAVQWQRGGMRDPDGLTNRH